MLKSTHCGRDTFKNHRNQIRKKKKKDREQKKFEELQEMKYTLQGALPNAFVCITACDSQFFKGDTVFVPFYRWENKRSQRLNALLRGGRVENLGAQTSDSHMQPQTGNFQQPESG